MDGEEMQLSNKAWLIYKDGHWIWTGVTKKYDKELTLLFWNKFNISEFSARLFISTCHALITWFELWRIEGTKNYFALAGGSSYRGFELPTVKL